MECTGNWKEGGIVNGDNPKGCTDWGSRKDTSSGEGADLKLCKLLIVRPQVKRRFHQHKPLSMDGAGVGLDQSVLERALGRS